MVVRPEKTVLKLKEIESINLQKELIKKDLKPVISDLMLLAFSNKLRQLINNYDPASQKELIEEFIIFAKTKKIYDQIRLLDRKGQEKIRVNYNNGNPQAVTDKKLKAKGHRNYFQNTIQLDPREIYISPFELNMENGGVEYPLKPVIRFGTPVFNSKGQKKGIAIINYMGIKLLGNIIKESDKTLGHIMLLNSDGYYLYGSRSGTSTGHVVLYDAEGSTLYSSNIENDWDFMFDGRKNRTFGNEFQEAWSQISTEESGQLFTNKGMFSFTTIHVTGKDSWKIISHIDDDTLSHGTYEFFSKMLSVYAALSIILAVFSWFLARFNILHKQAELKIVTLSQAVEQSPGTIMITDIEGNIEYVNPKFTQLTGYTLEEVYGKNARILGSGTMTKEESGKLWNVLRSGMEWRGELQNKKKDGALYWEFASISPVWLPDDDNTHFIKVGEDMTELKKTEDALKDSEENFHSIVQNSTDGILIVDHNGIIQYNNSSANKLLGRKNEKLSGSKFEYTLESKETREIDITRKNGVRGIGEMSILETKWQHKKDNMIFIRDITDNLESIEKARHHSITDNLTGFHNLYGFKILAEQHLRTIKRKKQGLYILFVKADIKENDKPDQYSMNQAIISTASILRQTLRESDIIARVSENKFAFIPVGNYVSNPNIFVERALEKLTLHNASKNSKDELSLNFDILHYDSKSKGTVVDFIDKAL